jgi:hypothetical protein
VPSHCVFCGKERLGAGTQEAADTQEAGDSGVSELSGEEGERERERSERERKSEERERESEGG